MSRCDAIWSEKHHEMRHEQTNELQMWIHTFPC